MEQHEGIRDASSRADAAKRRRASTISLSDIEADSRVASLFGDPDAFNEVDLAILDRMLEDDAVSYTEPQAMTDLSQPEIEKMALTVDTILQDAKMQNKFDAEFQQPADSIPVSDTRKWSIEAPPPRTARRKRRDNKPKKRDEGLGQPSKSVDSFGLHTKHASKVRKKERKEKEQHAEEPTRKDSDITRNQAESLDRQVRRISDHSHLKPSPSYGFQGGDPWPRPRYTLPQRYENFHQDVPVYNTDQPAPSMVPETRTSAMMTQASGPSFRSATPYEKRQPTCDRCRMNSTCRLCGRNVSNDRLSRSCSSCRNPCHAHRCRYCEAHEHHTGAPRKSRQRCFHPSRFSVDSGRNKEETMDDVPDDGYEEEPPQIYSRSRRHPGNNSKEVFYFTRALPDRHSTPSPKRKTVTTRHYRKASETGRRRNRTPISVEETTSSEIVEEFRRPPRKDAYMAESRRGRFDASSKSPGVRPPFGEHFERGRSFRRSPHYETAFEEPPLSYGGDFQRGRSVDPRYTNSVSSQVWIITVTFFS